MSKKKNKDKDSINKKKMILDKYISLLQKDLDKISISDICSKNITEGSLRHHWGSLSSLDQEARIQRPDLYNDIPLEQLLKPKNKKTLHNNIKKYKRFFVTTAVCGTYVDKNFFKSIKSYCKKNDAELLILVISDPAYIKSPGGYGYIDSCLEKECVVSEDTLLNSNIFLSTIKLSAKHIDPITGLHRIGQRNGSFIYASPKQRMKVTPVSNPEKPHVLMTTGAITLPDYTSGMYMSQRTAYIAEHDHVMGGLIVEIEDDKIFYYRQVQADSNGAFIDLGVSYSGNRSRKVRPAALVPGDIHYKDTDPLVQKIIDELTEELKPKRKVFHDCFTGMAINHHEEKNKILKARRSELGQLCLYDELKGLSDYLLEQSKTVDELVIVKSNHDEFLERYLREGKYVNDPLNHRLSLVLAAALLDGKDPLKVGVEMFNDFGNNVRWLKRDEDYTVARVQLSAHGDKGANGARGNIRSSEMAYGNSITGHTHSPEILRGAYSVGTSTYLKLGYNFGPSSWMQTMCILYDNGSRQLINVINGRYKI